jgi:hypothetical protein
VLLNPTPPYKKEIPSLALAPCVKYNKGNMIIVVYPHLNLMFALILVLTPGDIR